MKKSIKKVLSLTLVLVMLCSMMSISAFAYSDTDTYTVYFTTGNFTPGDYDFVLDEPILSEYDGDSPIPSSSSAFSSDLYGVTVTRGEIITYFNTIRSYDVDGEISSTPNVLDVIIRALQKNSRIPSVGLEYDYYGSGGLLGAALYGFANDGSTEYHGYEEYYTENFSHLYYHYTGTNWQFAYNTSVGGQLTAASTYGTNITNLFNGMHIVVDLSEYDMYYKIY